MRKTFITVLVAVGSLVLVPATAFAAVSHPINGTNCSATVYGPLNAGGSDSYGGGISCGGAQHGLPKQGEVCEDVYNGGTHSWYRIAHSCSDSGVTTANPDRWGIGTNFYGVTWGVTYRIEMVKALVNLNGNWINSGTFYSQSCTWPNCGG